MYPCLAKIHTHFHPVHVHTVQGPTHNNNVLNKASSRYRTPPKWEVLLCSIPGFSHFNRCTNVMIVVVCDVRYINYCCPKLREYVSSPDSIAVVTDFENFSKI